MPHFYAHRVFGMLVWQALPEETKRKLQAQQEGFQLGLYGPDPLFFVRSGREEGIRQHSLPPGQVLARWSAYAHQPQVLGYAAGWLCHYMLDAACHPIIRALGKETAVSHAKVELAFDRRLMQRFSLPKEAPFSPETLQAAALGCGRVTPKEFRRGLGGFYRFSYTTARLYPGHGDRTATAKLTARLHRSAEPCAEACARLVDCLESGKGLDWLPRVNFYGQEVIFPSTR